MELPQAGLNSPWRRIILISASLTILVAGYFFSARWSGKTQFANLANTYLDYLSKFSENPEAATAVEFLNKHGTAIRIEKIANVGRGDVNAFFDGSRNTIVLSPNIVKNLGIAEGTSDFIEMTAGVVVHELQHAMDFQATGLNSNESELLAVTAEALFENHRAKRGRTPRAEALVRSIGVVCEPWYQCIQDKKSEALMAKALVSGEMQEDLVLAQISNVKAAASGWKGIIDLFEGLGYNLPSVLANDADEIKRAANELGSSPDYRSEFGDRLEGSSSEKAQVISRSRNMLNAWLDDARVAGAKRYYSTQLRNAEIRANSHP